MSAVAGMRTEFRSRPALVTGSLVSLALVVVFGGMWVALGPTIRCDEQGLHVRNAVITHHYEWSEVHGAELGQGDPWAYVLLSPTPEQPDGETQMALGIQRAEAGADERIAELRAAIAHFKSTRG